MLALVPVLVLVLVPKISTATSTGTGTVLVLGTGTSTLTVVLHLLFTYKDQRNKDMRQITNKYSQFNFFVRLTVGCGTKKFSFETF